MTRRIKKTATILGGVILLSALSLSYFASFNTNLSNSNNSNVSYIYTFENFSKDTEIEMIQNNKDQLSSDIIDLSKDMIVPDRALLTLFHIRDENGFVDIQIHQSSEDNSLQFQLSGLKSGNKVFISPTANQTAIPVDWVGKITLSHNLSDQYCLNIITDKTQQICLSPHHPQGVS